VTWDSIEFITVDQRDDISSTVERMFVRTYKNGCRPRYECIQFRLVAPGVLLYRRSRYRIWPFNGTTGITIDCRSLFTYDEQGYQVIVSTSGPSAWCRLPANVVYEELRVDFKSGLRCRGVMRLGSLETGSDALSTSFRLLLRDCPEGHNSEQVYRCLASGGQFDAGDGGVKMNDVVLVSADGADGELLCWWFGHTDPQRFYLLAASACYGGGRSTAAPEPLAVFTRPVSASTSHVVMAAAAATTARTHNIDTEQVTGVVNRSCNVKANWLLYVVFMLVLSERQVIQLKC